MLTLVYFFTLAFFTASILQCLCLGQLNLNVLYDNEIAGLWLSVLGLVAIVLQRFMNGCASLWLQVLYAALAFESVTIGVAGLTYSYAFTQLAIFCGIVSLLIAFLPFVGAGLAKLDITRCVGWLLLSSLACLMVCVLVLTLLLSFNCQVTIVNLMLIGAFIAVLFSAAHDSRIVHRLNANDSLDSKQCLRYSLFLYGEMIFVWLLLLHVS